MSNSSTVGHRVVAGLVRALFGGPRQATPGIEGRDIAGILMGAPILLAGIPLILNGPSEILYLVWGLSLLLVSIGLFIPSNLYESGMTRAIGFAAAVLAIGVLADFAVGIGFCAQWLFSNADDEWALLGVIFGAIGLAGFGYALGCTIVLLKKLRPRAGYAAITIAVGLAVGALHILLMYLLHCSPFFDTAG